MTLFYRKSCLVLNGHWDSQSCFFPSLEIPERGANFPIFLWQKSLGEDSGQGQMPTPEPITCFAWVQLFGPGRRQEVLIWQFSKRKPGVFARWKGTALDNESYICLYKFHSFCSLSQVFWPCSKPTQKVIFLNISLDIYTWLRSTPAKEKGGKVWIWEMS